MFIGFNGKLHFADDIIVKLEYQRDVMSIQLQAVLDLQETDPILRMGWVQLLEVLDDLDNLLLFGPELASHQIRYRKGDQVGRGGPLDMGNSLLVVKLPWNIQKPMDQSVYVRNQIVVEVLYQIQR